MTPATSARSTRGAPPRTRAWPYRVRLDGWARAGAESDVHYLADNRAICGYFAAPAVWKLVGSLKGHSVCPHCFDELAGGGR
jgi:hypothetical protein